MVSGDRINLKIKKNEKISGNDWMVVLPQRHAMNLEEQLGFLFINIQVFHLTVNESHHGLVLNHFDVKEVDIGINKELKLTLNINIGKRVEFAFMFEVQNGFIGCKHLFLGKIA